MQKISTLTEFIVSTRLIFWGDQLDPQHLAQTLDLDFSLCFMAKKGDLHRKDNKKDQTSREKTGKLIYEYCKGLSTAERNPEVQLSFFSDLLTKLPSDFAKKYSVDLSEFQMSIYYGDLAPGEPDFLIPCDFLARLSSHQIRFCITVLP